MANAEAGSWMLLLVVVTAISRVHVAAAADADPLQDFCVTDAARQGVVYTNGYACKSPAAVTAADFSSAALAAPGNTSNPLGVSVVLASAASVGGLNTQGLSFARIDYAKGGVVPPHVHPRASEILFVVSGTLHVGFVDSSNALFSRVLRPGELFVFPRGLVHFIYNVGPKSAFSLSSLNSQNPGTSLLPSALFGAHPSLDDQVLQKAFQLSRAQVHHLKKAFA